MLTKCCVVGLRITVRLAEAELDSRNVTIKAISANLGVPQYSVAQIVSGLSRLGIIETQRGRSGGIRITRFGLNIRVGRLANELENMGLNDVKESIKVKQASVRDDRLDGILKFAREEYFKYLDNHSVSEFRNPEMIQVQNLKFNDGHSAFLG